MNLLPFSSEDVPSAEAEAIDEADALPKRKRSEVMSLFSNTKVEGEHVDEAAIVRLLVNTYGRTQVL